MRASASVAALCLLSAACQAQWLSWLQDLTSAVSSLQTAWQEPPRPVHPLANLSTPELVRQYGRTAQVHHVTTADGYILELHRVQGDHAGSVVLVNHGVLCSSADWVLAGPSKALGLILADEGYDVWLGNFRGNRYSNKHVNLTTDDMDYWNFSFHEMGIYDLPAEIDYILNATGKSKLHYVGFSMGVSSFFVMMSEWPEYNQKVWTLVGMAPAAYMMHTTGPFYRLASMSQGVLQLGNVFGWGEFLTSHTLLAEWGQHYCEAHPLYQDFCSNSVFLVTGYNSPQFNKTLLPIVLGHIPAGASTKTLMHYVQIISSGEFQQYDDRVLPASLSLWQPTKYNLSHVVVPTFLVYGSGDWIVNNTDVEQTFNELNGTVEKQKLLLDDFNHLDFLYAINASSLVYSRITDFLRNHTALQTN